MIFMRVRENNRVYMLCFCPQHLVSKIRGSIHYKTGCGRRNHDGTSQAVIPAIIGPAYGAITTDHGNTTACSGTKETNMKFGLRHPTNVIVNQKEYAL
jgi:hypothetical protein